MWLFRLHVCLCTMYVYCLKRLGKEIRPLRTGLIRSCKLSRVLITEILEEQTVPLTPEPSLQAPTSYALIVP